MAAAEVDWNSYFYSIKQACPWSWAAWKKGEIEIVQWKFGCQPLSPIIQARIYLTAYKPRQLKKTSNRLNKQRQTEEWLWSHPDFGFNSTPVPVFIQQHRNILENIRKSMKNIKKV